MSGSSINHGTLIIEARQIRDVVTKLNGFKLDHTEYTCLKALALFKPGKYTQRYKCQKIYFESIYKQHRKANIYNL